MSQGPWVITNKFGDEINRYVKPDAKATDKEPYVYWYFDQTISKRISGNIFKVINYVRKKRGVKMDWSYKP